MMVTLGPISRFGVIEVLVRAGPDVLSGKLPRYVVSDTRNGKILEEFRKRRAAESWARRNKRG